MNRTRATGMHSQQKTFNLDKYEIHVGSAKDLTTPLKGCPQRHPFRLGVLGVYLTVFFLWQAARTGCAMS